MTAEAKGRLQHTKGTENEPCVHAKLQSREVPNHLLCSLVDHGLYSSKTPSHYATTNHVMFELISVSVGHVWI
jgi:hypothetical protein